MASSATPPTPTSSTPPAVAATVAASSCSNMNLNKCFNSDCKEFKLRKGWRLKSGEFAELCDRCASYFEEGRFCDKFHLKATGWRCCESCGKQIHCGCIVSAHSFVLLDAGGIDCIICARKKVLPSTTPWPPPLYYNTPLSERFKDLSVKPWSQLARSGPVPWRQAPSLFNTPISRSDVHPRTLYEMDRLAAAERSSTPSQEKGRMEDFSERLPNGNLKPGTRDVLENGNAGASIEEKPGSFLGIPHQPSSLREDPSIAQRIAMPFTSLNDPNIGVSGSPLRQPAPLLLAKQFNGNLHNGIESLPDSHIRNARPRADARARSQLLPRYWPRFTDEELQQISGNSNSVITPLFEKMLSASDAGRIGRLVLPKKCAEAYFPPISNPEGLPLKVQDSKGREWIFQFRFWPNNNSRMYVLEGVTPCIQNMRLQAGDIVTFSRLEPEGKLVMGFRKTSNAPSSDQDNDSSKAVNVASTNGDADLVDPSPWAKVDKSGYIAKEVLEAKSSIKKRKSSTLGSKSKRLRIETEDMIELKLTWEEAQGLFRPPPDNVPSVVVIEGFEFEEYEDAPILGKPTIFATDTSGEKVQWVQCEDCFKWRKLPVNADLPSKWTCVSNSWDPERSFCSAAQELTTEQIEELLPSCNLASKKLKSAKQETENVEALEGLDTLANLAILGENEALPNSSHATTRHPRHRPGCSCIVCIQPPSGKGPKHKQTCTCNVCLTVKRRFKTLMMKREKKQSEKEAETTKKKSPQPLPLKLEDGDPSPSSNTESSSPNKNKVVGEVSDEDPNRIKSSSSPFKGQIDLNIQPEREDELSPGSDPGSMMKMIQEATERYLRPPRFSGSDNDNNSADKQTMPTQTPGEKVGNGIIQASIHQDSKEDHPSSLSTKISGSSSAIG